MMILGFAGVGFMAYRRKRNENALTAPDLTRENNSKAALYPGRLFLSASLSPTLPQSPQ